MLKKKSKKKHVTVWNNFVQHSVSHATRNIFVTKTTKIWSQTHKNPLKTHIEALKIQNFFSGEAYNPPPLPLKWGGEIPLSCSPPLVPSALDGFLRRTTFKYAAMALKTHVIRISFPTRISKIQSKPTFDTRWTAVQRIYMLTKSITQV